MKIPGLLHDVSPLKRRRFLKLMGAAMAAPMITPALRYAANELAFGTAHADMAAGQVPTYFVEINLRDQWDFGHVFVPPGLATHGSLRRGTAGRQCALFYQPNEITQGPNNLYLTNDSLELQPHLDNIAMFDTCELSKGRIHGHEAANCTRSPGRDYSGGNGRRAMWEGEPGYHEQGNEPHYSSTPTPAALHNYWQKQVTPDVRNGLAFKGISRAHTTYHFGGDLPGAEPDRFQARQALFNAFPDTVEDYNILPTEAEASTLTRILKKVDERFFNKYNYSHDAQQNHLAQLEEGQGRLYVGEPKIFHLPLTPEEEAYWSADVPAQRGVQSGIKFQIWEQAAWAFKLINSGLVRTVALEFDYVDVHDQRTEDQMRVMGKQAALPLARLISKFKEAGIWENTVIAVYSTDGGRAPAAGSQGNEGKNTTILAGGKIQGGYYGDVRVAGDNGNGHNYSYHRPDPNTGAPIANGSTGNDKRLPGRDVWRTTMRALQIPDSVSGQFADVQNGQVQDYALRG